MDPTINGFEQLCFNPFTTDDSVFTDDNDPDQNYFNEDNFTAYDTPYVFQNTKSILHETKQYENLSLLHLNIRSLNDNFENFRNLLEDSEFSFNVICLSETWSTDKDFRDNSDYHLSNYYTIHSERKIKKKGGGVLIYVKTNLIYKIRGDLSISDYEGEFLSIEILFWVKQTQNGHVNTQQFENDAESWTYNGTNEEPTYAEDGLKEIFQSTCRRTLCSVRRLLLMPTYGLCMGEWATL